MYTFANPIKKRLFISYHNKLFYKITKILGINFSMSCIHNKDEFSISKHLQSKIKACGPITVAEFMKEALTNPVGGYYINKDVFGKTGDFITSPEISPLFGEMIGVWVLNEWRKITKDDFHLVELGPGRGSLTREILKIFKRFKMLEKVSVHLVEVSPALLDIQAEQLSVTLKETPTVSDTNGKPSISHYKEGVTADGTKVFWYRAVEDVPKKFSIFVAHEFFDALPIHKYQKIKGSWREIFIDIDPKNDDKFRYVISSFPTLTSKLFITENEQRDHVEVSPQTLTTVDYLAQFLKENGGIMLIVDYGHIGDKMDTFRAFKNHQQQDPLLNPGSADLTADVDFSMIKKIATKDNRTIVFGPTTQRKFLLQLGIEVRLKMLQKMTDAQRSQLTSEYRMLTDHDKMGECFKAMAIFPAVLEQHLTMWPVAGFYEEKERKENNNKNQIHRQEAIASQSKSTFFSISASSLTSKWVGEGEKMVRALFAVARVHQPSVIFIDEIDSLLTQRSETEHESSRRIKTEFLVQLDGATTGDEDRILVIGATNRPQELDEAARRRFVKRLYVPLPEFEARRQIVENLLANERHELTNEDIDKIAAMSENYSGADMTNLCKEASMGPIRSISFEQLENIRKEDVRCVTAEDFENALCLVRPSVSQEDLGVYVQWDATYGSGTAENKSK